MSFADKFEPAVTQRRNVETEAINKDRRSVEINLEEAMAAFQALIATENVGVENALVQTEESPRSVEDGGDPDNASSAIEGWEQMDENVCVGFVSTQTGQASDRAMLQKDRPSLMSLTFDHELTPKFDALMSQSKLPIIQDFARGISLAKSQLESNTITR